jgi:hypothetical protein
MSTDNVRPFKTREVASEEKQRSLVELIQSLDNWRANKKRTNDPIPPTLWDRVISLLDTFSESQIIRATGIQMSMLRRKLSERQAITSPSTVPQVSSPEETLDFCEVNKAEEPSYPLAYKPAEAFTTTTSVVELYRKDGALMKIHICTERFDELLRAFFNGCD